MFGFGFTMILERMLGMPERSLTVPYRIIILFCSMWSLGLVFLTKRRFFAKRYLIPLIIFWTVYSLRFYIDAYVYDRPLPLGNLPEEVAFYIFGMCFFPMLAIFIEPGFHHNSRIVKSSIVILALSCAAVLIFNRDVLYSNFGRLHVEGSLNQITLGHLGVSLCLLCLYLLFLPQAGSRIMNLILIGLIGFGLAVMGLASSRSPIIAFVFLLPFLCIFGLRHGQKLRVSFLVGMLVCSLPFGFAAIREMGSNIEDRVAGTFSDVEDGSESRLDLWKSAWEDFVDHPLTGGTFNGRYDTYPHNLLLESLMTTGIVGGVSFMWILLIGIQAAWKLIRHSADHAWLGFLFFQMFVYAMFSGALWSHFSFWYLLAAVLTRWYGPCVSLSAPSVKNRPAAFAVKVPFFASAR